MKPHLHYPDCKICGIWWTISYFLVDIFYHLSSGYRVLGIVQSVGYGKIWNQISSPCRNFISYRFSEPHPKNCSLQISVDRHYSFKIRMCWRIYCTFIFIAWRLDIYFFSYICSAPDTFYFFLPFLLKGYCDLKNSLVKVIYFTIY